MNEVEKLNARLISSGVKDFKAFIDYNNPPTAENLAREMNKVLDQLESGEYTMSDFDDKYLIEND
jgi:hypothetical protein